MELDYQKEQFTNRHIPTTLNKDQAAGNLFTLHSPFFFFFFTLGMQEEGPTDTRAHTLRSNHFVGYSGYSCTGHNDHLKVICSPYCKLNCKF